MLKLIPRERKTTVKELQDKLEGLGYSINRRTVELDLDRLSIPFTLVSRSSSQKVKHPVSVNNSFIYCRTIRLDIPAGIGFK